MGSALALPSAIVDFTRRRQPLVNRVFTGALNHQGILRKEIDMWLDQPMTDDKHPIISTIEAYAWGHELDACVDAWLTGTVGDDEVWRRIEVLLADPRRFADIIGHDFDGEWEKNPPETNAAAEAMEKGYRRAEALRTLLARLRDRPHPPLAGDAALQVRQFLFELMNVAWDFSNPLRNHAKAMLKQFNLDTAPVPNDP